jgi:hypothetical protein
LLPVEELEEGITFQVLELVGVMVAVMEQAEELE